MKYNLPPKPIERKVIASPEDFKPSSKNTKIVGTFNPGITTIQTSKDLETILLLRIAETYKETSEEFVYLPFFKDVSSTNKKPQIYFDKEPITNISCQGKKHVTIKNKKNRLKHISYIKIVTLKDDWLIVWNKQNLMPECEPEEFGTEDPRITKFKQKLAGEIGFKYGISYVIPHRKHRVSTMMALTNDFIDFKKLPLGNTPRPFQYGKDIAIFPELIKSECKDIFTREKNPQFVYLGRPDNFPDISNPGISIFYSPDLVSKGLPHSIIQNENITVGTGTPPIEIDRMWFGAYHEAIPKKKQNENDHTHKYHTKLFALDKKFPWKVKHLSETLLKREDYKDILPEDGYVPNVVYTTGITHDEKKGIIELYSGIDDTWTVVDIFHEEELVKFLKQN